MGNGQWARLTMLPHHESYHIGQVMYVRALQGLKTIQWLCFRADLSGVLQVVERSFTGST